MKYYTNKVIYGSCRQLPLFTSERDYKNFIDAYKIISIGCGLTRVSPKRLEQGYHILKALKRLRRLNDKDIYYSNTASVYNENIVKRLEEQEDKQEQVINNLLKAYKVNLYLERSTYARLTKSKDNRESIYLYCEQE